MNNNDGNGVLRRFSMLVAAPDDHLDGSANTRCGGG